MKGGYRGKIVYARNGKRTYELDGKEVSKEEFDEAFPEKEIGVPETAHSSCWPATSLALSVHPKQAQKANERAKRHGIAASYAPDGTCHLADRAARKKLLRLEGMHDNKGGYGD